jgi:negative regulator of replication initiation
MMPTIRIDDEVWRYLQGKARPFEDSPNDVLRRQFGLNKATNQSPPATVSHRAELGRRSRESLQPDRDYTDHAVAGYRLDDNFVPCRFFKDVLIGLSNLLRAHNEAAFDQAALKLRGTKRVYFSRNAADLKFAQQLTGHGLFVETNLNANLIVGICRQLLVNLGRDPSTFEVV